MNHDHIVETFTALGEHLESRFQRVEYQAWVLAIGMVLLWQYDTMRIRQLSDRLEAVENAK